MSKTTTGCLSDKLSLKKCPRIMLISNKNLKDRFINGKIDFLYDFAFKDKITEVYVNFVDIKVEKDARINYTSAWRKDVKPIEMVVTIHNEGIVKAG